MGGDLTVFWGELQAQFAHFIAWANLDLSAATLAKYGVLILVVVALLWVLGDVYRGEIQNQDLPVDIISSDALSGQKGDVLFAKRTLDIRTASLPAHLSFYHKFTILDGDREVRKKVLVYACPLRLSMQPRVSKYLPLGSLALHAEHELALKAKAEKLVRDAVRKYRRNWFRRLHKGTGKDAGEADAVARSYAARIHFPSNPIFLLFMHPDREVKATGWLTLLTSLFALLAQFLFQSPDLPNASSDAPRRVPPIVRLSP